MIDTDKYEGHTEGPWAWDDLHSSGKEMLFVHRKGNDNDIIANVNGVINGKLESANAQLIADAPLFLAEVKRLHKNKFNLFTTIEQKLNEKGDEGEAIWEANPNGHYKEDELRGWCEALEFVLNLMKAQEREE